MIKNIYVISCSLLLGGIALSGAAQDVVTSENATGIAVTKSESTDSIAVSELQEIVIEARGQYFTAKGAVYTPTQSQKNAAMSGTDLLTLMAIPQLNPMSGSEVTDMFGHSVPVFINYELASKEDLAGLRTADVIKVQYLESPTDPRFRNADKAINFIVKVYEFGGYTKLSATEHALVGLSSDANVFSKFSYKAMTYDVYAAAQNWYIPKGGESQLSVFRGVSAQDGSEAPERNLEMHRGKTRQGNYPVTFRATYSSPTVSLVNKLGYIHYGIPMSKSSGSLS